MWPQHLVRQRDGVAQTGQGGDAVPFQEGLPLASVVQSPRATACRSSRYPSSQVCQQPEVAVEETSLVFCTGRHQKINIAVCRIKFAICRRAKYVQTLYAKTAAQFSDGEAVLIYECNHGLSCRLYAASASLKAFVELHGGLATGLVQCLQFETLTTLASASRVLLSPCTA